jgi:hypothetical protein
VFLYNSSGGPAHQIGIWPNGAVTLWLASAAVGEGTNEIVVSGQGTASDKTRFNFVASSTLDGSIVHYFDTGRYIAMQACQSPDGSIWTIGTIIPRKGDPSSSTDYDALRHYSATGVLLESFLSHREVGVDYRQSWQHSSQVYLRSTRGSVVLYDGIQNRVYRYDLSAKVLHGWSITGTFGDMELTGFGVSQVGGIYASLIAPDDRKIATRGLFQLVTTSIEPSAQWRPVPGTTVVPNPLAQSVGTFKMLLGFDGNDAVYRIQQQSPSPVMLFWSHL